MTPDEHYRVAVHLADLTGEEPDLMAIVTAINANTHAHLAGLRDFSVRDDLLHQAELELEEAKQRIRHLESLLGDRYADLISDTGQDEPSDGADA